jgi:crotonobetainyl-CoA:carnitine CoA-transferase CaiB-like acyl-CoA transferase
VITFLRDTFSAKTRDEWDAWLARIDVCYGVVKTLPEALEDPQLLARDMIVKDAQGRRHLTSAIRFRDEPAQLDLNEPELGAHNGSLAW